MTSLPPSPCRPARLRESLAALLLVLGAPGPLSAAQEQVPREEPATESGEPQEEEERRAIPPAPERGGDEGEGPFERLVVRQVTLVDGSGAPARGPVDIVIEGDRIAAIRASAPDLPEAPGDGEPAGREMDATGMYALPGFVDLHGHIGGTAQGTPAEYVYKLWMGHGITTVRDPGSGNGLEWTLRERERSARNEIVAPRIFVYRSAGADWDRGALDTPETGREWVRWLAEQGADGVKVRDVYDPAVAGAIFEEAAEAGLGTAAHLTQLGVARMDALQAARRGLGTLEHWYGLPEALFDDRTVQAFPPDYNYLDEYDRFREAGRLWKQAAAPGSERWREVMGELLELGLGLTPTLTIYEANRDVMREREAEWHEEYTLPSLWEYFQPSPEAHGSYWFRWSTADEIAWKENFRRWMTFLEEYRNRGGSVCTGSDSGFIYKIYGFGYVRELELLQEAGFHPLEVVRAASLCGAETLSAPAGEEIDFGVVRPGLKADLILLERNPLEDFKLLYGTGAVRLDPETGDVGRAGGIRYTIKDGIVYDAGRLRADVRRMVREAEEEEN